MQLTEWKRVYLSITICVLKSGQKFNILKMKSAILEEEKNVFVRIFGNT